jgi:hypothetical protein
MLDPTEEDSESSIADFLADVGASSSSDEELRHAHPPAAESSGDSSNDELPPPPPPQLLLASSAAGSAAGSAWEQLATSFRRSDPPQAVLRSFFSIGTWREPACQEKLWHRVLSSRVKNGAGSRGYIFNILKGLVAECDRQRLEVSEVILEHMLGLQAGAGSRPTAQVQIEPTDPPPTNPSPLAAMPKILRPAEPEPEQRTSSPVSDASPPLRQLHPMHILCLGSDCFCRTEATHCGYMRCRAEGYRSSPFDIAYHSYLPRAS